VWTPAKIRAATVPEAQRRGKVCEPSILRPSLDPAERRALRAIVEKRRPVERQLV
jgi:hypothetical protein